MCQGIDLKELLENIAKRETWLDDEDFNPYDFSGGNYDDAYFSGREDGRTELARELLNLYFKENTNS